MLKYAIMTMKTRLLHLLSIIIFCFLIVLSIFHTASFADNCIFWNNLNSNYDVTHSMIGPNGLITGTPSYSTGEFGNGIDGLTDPSGNYVVFPEAVIHPQYFTLEFWWKPHFAANESNYNTLCSIRTDNTDNLIRIFVLPGGTIECDILQHSPAGGYLPYCPSYYWKSIPFTAGSLHNLAFAFDPSAGSHQKIKFFYDGNYVSAEVNQFHNGAFYEDKDYPWEWSGRYDIRTSIAAGWDSNALFDNIRVFDYIKTDFSDRFSEEAGVNNPTVNVIKPNGGEVVSTEIFSCPIQYDINGSPASNVNIRLSKDSGTSWDTLLTAEAGNFYETCTYEWMPKNSNASTGCLISIEAINNIGASHDASNANFEVYKAITPEVQLIWPNGGEVATAEMFVWPIIYNITGAATAINIRLSRNDGITWGTLITSEVGIFYGICTYEWRPTNSLASKHCMISIEALNINGYSKDKSNSAFEVKLFPEKVHNITKVKSYPTIQQAFDAASDGDIIELDPGVFTGNGNGRGIDWPYTNNITLRGAGPGLTTLDAQLSDYCMYITPYESLSFTIEAISFVNTSYPTYGDNAIFIYIDDSAPAFNHINNCSFVGNECGRWGIIYYETDPYYGYPTLLRIENSTFKDNNTTILGPVLSTSYSGSIEVLNCNFINTSKDDFTSDSKTFYGVLNIDDTSSMLIDNCDFISNQNRAIEASGGGSDLLFCRNSTFTDNGVLGYYGPINYMNPFPIAINGGAIQLWGGFSVATIENCTFDNNKGHEGGAIDIRFGSPAIYISKCSFSDNIASNGGAIRIRNEYTKVSDCTFNGNTAEATGGIGGAIQHIMWIGEFSTAYHDTSASIVNCLFKNNSASNGGAISSGWFGAGFWESRVVSLEIINCTFASNDALVTSGASAICFNGVLNPDSGILKNSIFWGNSSPDNTVIYDGFTDTSSLLISHSNIQGLSSGSVYQSRLLTGTIEANPLFIDSLNGNYRLSGSSPCLNTATGEGAPDHDLIGLSRPQGSGFDMGCYERLNVVDTTPPSSATISINSGAEFTTSTNVTLSLSASDSGAGMGPGAEMIFRNEANNWSTPEAYTTSTSWQLSTAEGSKTVYASFSDAIGNWMLTPVSDNITLDLTPPTGAVIINGGDTITNSNVVTLTISANDPLSGIGAGSMMKFSNDGANWSAAEPYSTTKTWSLIVGSGARTVYAKYSDVSGNWMTTPVTDTIDIVISPNTMIQEFEGFEGSTSGAIIDAVADSGSTLTCTVTTQESYSGKESLAVDYGGVAEAIIYVQLPAVVDMTSMEGIRLWLKGDGSSNYARIVLKESTVEADGELWQTPKFSLSDTDWHLVEYNFSTLTRASDSYSGNNIFDKIIEEYQIRFSITSGSIFRNSYALLSASDGLLLAGDVRIMSGGAGILYIDGVSAVSSTVPPSVDLLSPNGGESLNGNSTYSITWTATSSGSGIPSSPAKPIKLKLSTNGGSIWSTIASSENTGSYSWTVPNVTAPSCKIQVEARDALDHEGEDESVSTFSITAVSGGVQTEAANVKAGPSPYDPAGGNMKITYDLNTDAEVTVSVYNLDGKLLWQNRYSSAGAGGQNGSNSVEWDGKTGFGSTIQTGVYIYQVTAGGKVIGRGKFIVRR